MRVAVAPGGNALLKRGESMTATLTPLPPLSGSGGGVIAFQSDRDRQDEI